MATVHFCQDISDYPPFVIFCDIRQRWPGHYMIQVYKSEGVCVGGKRLDVQYFIV